jgi:nitrite reductase (NADH) small subunit
VTLCRVDEVPIGSHRLFDIGKFGIGLFNVGGQYFALLNYCPHRGGPLCQGKVTGTSDVDEANAVCWVKEGEIIRCPWHGWEFSIKDGCSITSPVRKVRTYPVRQEGDYVVIDIPIERT